ncbi:MAG: hypothetical protein CMC13_08410 [Flavobacteriaceae bacterium]|nr:hypothetical protein [Flavobacteriaceae bacterium]|tara:strand:+ start:2715 stop:3626 length:912 start_codon:yes stop_codon:yes gene_type:complete
MKSIVLIVPYLGKWPLWFDAHLVSIARNPTIDWLFITDCKIPGHYPDNIRFVSTTLGLLNTKINNTLGVEVPLSPRKLCDIRPAYGNIFQDYITEYDFWGFCDVDIVWGDIRNCLSNEMLTNYDILSSRKQTISGHFTILKNTKEINSLYKLIPDYFEMLSLAQLMRIDEEAFTETLKDPDTYNKLNIWWDAYLMNHNKGRAHQEYLLDKWLWKNGKMLELKNGKPIKEVMYLHFINWKRTMNYCKVEYKEHPKQFYISYNGIHYKQNSKISQILNDFKNLFNGYYALQKRKRLLKKITKRLK